MNFVLIDGSYYIFYRYYALCVWYNLCRKPDDPDLPSDSKMFMEKFRTTFVSKIEEIDGILGLETSIKIVGKDCPKSTIWRNKYIDNYKGTRKGDLDISSLFKVAYSEELFLKADCNRIVEHSQLEADDCLAITTGVIREKYPDAHVWIITSDMDYLQLACEQVTLVDLKYKKLTDNKTSFNDAEKDLFCKIVAGDKSDNIPSVLPRCGPKTAAKYFHDRTLFERKLKECEGATERYERNTTIVDFRCIPEELKNSFHKHLGDFEYTNHDAK